MQLKARSAGLVVVAVLVGLASPAAQSPAAPKVTSPKIFFGHDIGADYVLPNYTKFVEYVKKLDAESDRMIVQSIGKTAEGRDQLMAIVTAPETPDEYRAHLGRVSIKQTVPQLKAFAEAGGVIVAFGGSAVLGHHLGLPVSAHLVEIAQDGTERPLPGTKYYVPGGVLQVAVDNTNPTAFGFENKVDVFFDNSPVMELAPDAAMRGVKTVAWFDTKAPLRSGWAWGQHHLEGGTAGIEARLGKGKVFLFGPEITFRAQPHGTFKFLFNSIFYGTSVPAGSGVPTSTSTPQ